MTRQSRHLIDPVVAAGQLSRDAVIALSDRMAEPEWMKEKRLLAWSLYGQLPMPSYKDEHWRRTDLRQVAWDKLRLPAVDGQSALKASGYAIEPAGKTAGRLILVNDHVVDYQMDKTLAERGVIFSDLVSAVRNYPDLVKRHFMAASVLPGNSKFTAQHGAFWNAGVFIYVPKGIEVEHPFHIVTAMAGQDTALFPHSLVITEDLARVAVVDEVLSLEGGTQALSNGVVEIIAGAASRVSYTDLQMWGEHVFNLNTRRALLRPDSEVVWNTGQLGGRLTKTFVDSLLTGNGSSTRFNGLYFLDDHQHLDLDTLAHHFGVGTTGDILIKGAAAGSARAVLQGMIKIAPGAQQTDSYLKNDNLLLSDTARIDTIPGLEIDANDVRASHGATVSRTDEDQIFYLESRGIPRRTAIRIITEGFFASVFDRFEFEWVREKLAARIGEKIGG